MFPISSPTGGPSWRAWKVFLAAVFGLPLTKPQLALYQRHTGRKHAPRAPAREAWLPVGRRGGKSIIAALIAVFLAFFRDYRKFLAPGERATVMVIAADRRQARVVFRYITGLIDHTPMLARMVENRSRDALAVGREFNTTVEDRALVGYEVEEEFLAFGPLGHVAAVVVQPDHAARVKLGG